MSECITQQIAAEYRSDGVGDAEARSHAAAAVIEHVGTTIRNNGHALLDQGDEVSAAMYAIASGAVRAVPQQLLQAVGDWDASLTVLAAAKASLAAQNALLGSFQPSGSVPLFDALIATLSDAESVFR